MGRFYIIPRIGGLAYLNIPKSGCSSILFALSQMRKEKEFSPPRDKLSDGSLVIHGFHPEYSHINYFFMRWPNYLPPLPETFIKFTFVRNPYDRFYSFFKSKIRDQQNPGEYYKKFGLNKNSSFDECVTIITSLDPNQLENHAAPQSMILFDGKKLLVDFVGKTEKFFEDWNVITQLTGYKIDMEHLNPKLSEKDFEFSSDNKKRIFDYYKNDFELFGYDENSLLNYKTTDNNVMKENANFILKPEIIERLKKQISISNKQIRLKANDFTNNPEKRTVFFKCQNEKLRELILKLNYSTQKKIASLEKSKSELKSKFREYEKKYKLHIMQHFILSRRNLWNYFRRCFLTKCKSEVKIIEKSGLFDSNFYYSEYPNIGKLGITSVTHYVRFGAMQGKNPSSSFNTIDYMINNQDCLHYGINPLVHYILYKEM